MSKIDSSHLDGLLRTNILCFSTNAGSNDTRMIMFVKRNM